MFDKNSVSEYIYIPFSFVYRKIIEMSFNGIAFGFNFVKDFFYRKSLGLWQALKSFSDKKMLAGDCIFTAFPSLFSFVTLFCMRQIESV